jgi:hypothetical protein
LLGLVLLKLGALEDGADDGGRSLEKSRVFSAWKGAVEILNSISAYLSISLVIVLVLSELDVVATLRSVEGETGDDVEAIESSSVLSCSLCALIVLLLDELDVLAELDVCTMPDVLPEFRTVEAETNDDVRSIEGSYVDDAPGGCG